jgi:LPS O-antigen subunit length determinant protein (WzzB/FepE family)
MDKSFEQKTKTKENKKKRKKKTKKRKQQGQDQENNSCKKQKIENDQQTQNTNFVKFETFSVHTTISQGQMKKYPKKKVVLLVGYLGANYQGIQR